MPTPRTRIHWPHVGETFDGMTLLAFSRHRARPYFGVALVGAGVVGNYDGAEYRVLDCILVGHHHFIMSTMLDQFYGSDGLAKAVELFHRRLRNEHVAEQLSRLPTRADRAMALLQGELTAIELWMRDLVAWNGALLDQPQYQAGDPGGITNHNQAINAMVSSPTLADWVAYFARALELLDADVLADTPFEGPIRGPHSAEMG